MQFDLDQMDITELKALGKAVDKAIQNYEKQRKKRALEEMKAVAEKHGMSLAGFVAQIGA